MPAPLNANAALFLDIDGTLIDLAPSPQAVQVPPGLPETLREIRRRLSGALAVLSGRTLTDIDRLLGAGLPCAAEHGAVLRGADGALIRRSERPTAYEDWLQVLKTETATMPGVLIEEKEFSLVVHYRRAPQYQAQLGQMAERLVKESSDAVLLPAHCAYELKPAAGNKGEALAWFMERPPFIGRAAVFIGDDVTDEPAIQKAAELGGLGLHVARDFGGKTQAVRDWINSLKS